jgi:hypothetical protein
MKVGELAKITRSHPSSTVDVKAGDLGLIIRHDPVGYHNVDIWEVQLMNGKRFRYLESDLEAIK